MIHISIICMVDSDNKGQRAWMIHIGKIRL